MDGINLLITAVGSLPACVLFRAASQRPVTQFRDGAWYQGVPSEKCTKHLVPCHLVLCHRVQTGQMRLVICKEWIHICKNNVIKHQNTRYQALEHTCCQAPESFGDIVSKTTRSTVPGAGFAGDADTYCDITHCDPFQADQASLA